MWFRRDLRTEDLPALRAAAHAGGGQVVPLFVADPWLLRQSGPNRHRFLVEALTALDEELAGALVVRRGDPADVVTAAAAEAGARVVVATADFAPYGARRDQRVAARLAGADCRFLTVGSNYVAAPGTVHTAQGRSYRVYGAYRRAWRRQHPSVLHRPAPAVRPVALASDVSLAELVSVEPVRPGDGLPTWWEGLPMEEAPTLPPAGAAEARRRLERFVAEGRTERYADSRDVPGAPGTTGLSPYLRFGCLHPRTLLRALPPGPGAARLEEEVCWREFFADLLWDQPRSARENVQRWADRLAWDTGPGAEERFRAWATGRTGYDFVDAGMRQLLAEGWMHNRVRMVTASFLVKDLHLHWRWGARWFMWHLVDGDLASNQHGWQWVAGTGTDAAPFHRIMNPIVQQQRFDPTGIYVERFLGGPKGADSEPIVDHAVERTEALRRRAAARRGSVAAGGSDAARVAR